MVTKRNLFLMLMLVSVVALHLPTVFSQSSPIWVTGRVFSVVNEERYDLILYNVFNFTVWDSNGTLTIGENILTLVPSNLNLTVDQGDAYNFTGSIVDIQIGEIPAGALVVESVNVNTPKTDWVALLRYGISIFGNIMGSIVYSLAHLVFMGTGFMIPEAILTIVLVGFFVGFLLKYHKALGLMFILIIVLLIVSGCANLLRLAWS